MMSSSVAQASGHLQSPHPGKGGPCSAEVPATAAAAMGCGGRPPGLGARRTHRRRELRCRALGQLRSLAAGLEQEGEAVRGSPARRGPAGPCQPWFEGALCGACAGVMSCSALGPAPEDERLRPVRNLTLKLRLGSLNLMSRDGGSQT